MFKEAPKESIKPVEHVLRCCVFLMFTIAAFQRQTKLLELQLMFKWLEKSLMFRQLEDSLYIRSYVGLVPSMAEASR